MDEFYNKGNAAQLLGRIIEGRESGVDDAAKDLNLATCEIGRYTVHSFSQPRASRLCFEGAPGMDLEEASFRVQGVLCGKDLPPVVLNGNRSNRLRSRKFLRQSIKLTGFGNDDMLQCIGKIEAVYLKMLNQFREGSLEPWQPSVFEGNAALEASTRYFSQASHTTAEDVVDFAPHVDPDGRLRELMEADYVHTTDNRVDYMQQVTHPDGTRTYKAIDPVAFKHGDIVEATISFAAMPTKKNVAKMHVLLRALVLIDQTERNVSATYILGHIFEIDGLTRNRLIYSQLQTAAILRMRQRYKLGCAAVGRAVQPLLKRKAAYYDDETDTEETNRKMTRMRIDSDSE